ncbi:MAG TPA: glycoside hydrolase family 2 TIM barrel-domain containing protein, partial [Actinopolymorphaceae bacterium]|nr:glycoside hydrolase family 2 TIM barrel-domain containing protein [Actinopolymorphaceae bacterium]
MTKGSRVRKARLTGPWTVAGRPVAVPGCWEDAGIGKDEPGPFDYRTTLVLPEFGPDERVWLRFGAVSYACAVFVDGHRVGGHVGMWDGFEVEITSVVRGGGESDLVVRVEKPASLTAGPDSAPVHGSYPLRETLAGFLPYVWGHAHGGLWQHVELVVTGSEVFGDVTAWGTPDGALTVEATVGGPGVVALSVTDPSGTVLVEDEQPAERQARFVVTVPEPQPWSVDEPRLYTARVSLHADAGSGQGSSTSLADERSVRVGLRALDTDGSTLRLNGTPVYPRMILSWGWYPDRLHPAPAPDQVRADLQRLRQLGFNGVKLCLWFPPSYYLDIADELGMLVWVELPMWMPAPTEHFRAQLMVEADRLVRMARNHPSVILYTLGCELGAAVGDDILGPLYAHVKSLARDALVRDNSGSGEAYGGLLAEYADFYD